MEQLLIKVEGGRRRAYPVGAPARVRTHLGDGKLVYGTDDGWLAIQLDGETRVDEYPAERVIRLEVA